jgi:hypothetical protein
MPVDFRHAIRCDDISAESSSDAPLTTGPPNQYVIRQRLKWFGGTCFVAVVQIATGLVGILLVVLGSNPFVGLRSVAVGCGKLLYAPFGCFRSPNQKTPAAAARSFYSALFGLSRLPSPAWSPKDWAGALLVIMPSRRPSPFERLNTEWNDIVSAIKGLMIGEEVTCSRCARREFGLRIKESQDFKEYEKPEDRQIRSRDIFHACRQCQAVYCGPCFATLTDADICGGCGMFLPKGGHPPSLPIITPGRVEIQHVSITDVCVDETANRHVTSVAVTVLFEAGYGMAQKDPAKSKSYLLGPKGTLTCRFHNCAVQLNSRWYLVAPLPGEPVQGIADVSRELTG